MEDDEDDPQFCVHGTPVTVACDACDAQVEDDGWCDACQEGVHRDCTGVCLCECPYPEDFRET